MIPRHALTVFMALLVLAAAWGGGEPPRGRANDVTDEGASAPADDATTGDGGGEVTLVIESWRNDDLAIWEDTILPAFHEQHPDINVTFQPTAPDEYNAALESKLGGGTAGDLITCRPFDVSLGLYEDGHLEEITDLEGLDNF